MSSEGNSLPFSLTVLLGELTSDATSAVYALVITRGFRFPNIAETPVLIMRGSGSTSRGWAVRCTKPLITDAADSEELGIRLAFGKLPSDAKVACNFRGCLGILGLTERLRLSRAWPGILLKGRTGPSGGVRATVERG